MGRDLELAWKRFLGVSTRSKKHWQAHAQPLLCSVEGSSSVKERSQVTGPQGRKACLHRARSRPQQSNWFGSCCCLIVHPCWCWLCSGDAPAARQERAACNATLPHSWMGACMHSNEMSSVSRACMLWSGFAHLISKQLIFSERQMHRSAPC